MHIYVVRLSDNPFVTTITKLIVVEHRHTHTHYTLLPASQPVSVTVAQRRPQQQQQSSDIAMQAPFLPPSITLLLQ